ncbi:transcriptional regulator, PadR-like family [Sulfolobus islandicus Y.G.57.14]|uniref:Transcriptional regulator PadR family protein n=3 Tax=Saccharolobus islandicus TaxID=43080 RepID=C3MPL3_SACI2|nr:PadR family transcriptional regulator [Sulfolobus islandicus]ACP35326.1 transcriptional regulator PadR family protein [Sulfolobus islandicus L.S.2.15]ACP45483.1 transcriptional regulator, PadR-like family [Sulfolobus islandicus Y.G.57.14]ADB87008.1 transcriptional regulator PadR family protein [Sulfolobus islandicus L.D.8.5]PVU78542.1 PadR family transcriptional regulator [Sulfolobus islandicus]
MARRTEKILGGIITLLILKTLLEEPKHGYELEKIIREKLDYKLPEGSIYVILKNLERRGLTIPQVMKNERGQEIKKYFITDKGKRFLLSHEKPLIAVKKVLDELIADIQKLKVRE